MNGSQENALIVKDLSKSFRLPHEQASGLKQALLNVFRRPSRRAKGYEIQHVLNGISFEVRRGEFFGIVGRNGSGKSTLLKLLANIYVPDRGLIQINGSLVPFIELGVGFNPELTGRENVYLNGALLGFSRPEVEAMYDDIVGFAELEKFMDQKLKNYSSGMQVRLAFSIAIRAKSDILLLDEVLAVGDAAFQAKCFEYFRELKRDGRTIILVSHDRSAIEQYCDRAALVEKGRLVAVDTPRSIFSMYSDVTQSQIEEERGDSQEVVKRRDDSPVTIEGLKVFVNGVPDKKAAGPGDELKFVVKVRANRDVESPVYGITMSRTGEMPVYATNTLVGDVSTESLKRGQRASIEFGVKNIFGDGKYSLTPAVADTNGVVMLDRYEGINSIRVIGNKNSYALVNPTTTIHIS